MKQIKFKDETYWISIPANVEKIVAHFKDGHCETMNFTDILFLRPSRKKQIFLLDCYEKGELNI